MGGVVKPEKPWVCLRHTPDAKSVWDRQITFAGDPMTALHAFGRAAPLAAALTLLVGMRPAAAEEVAYLLYIKGTEGKTTPFRVLWDEPDDVHGRLTVDFGLGYEGFLKKLGVPRVKSFDARLMRGDFVVRDAELDHLVKIVVTELVRPPEKAGVTAGGAAAAPEADVKGALVLITPAPDKTRLEVTVRLHVSYPAPQRSGPPIVKDFVNGDLVFDGPRELKGASPAPNQKSR